MNWKKWTMLLVAVCALLLACSLAWWRIDPGCRAVRQPGGAETVDPTFWGLFDCEQTEDGLHIREGYPMLHFVPRRDVRSVVLWLSRPAGEQIPLRIYYAGENMPLGEDYVQTLTIFPGSESVGLNLPEGNYELIRIDFSRDIPLREITVSTEPLVWIRSPYRPSFPLLVGIAAGFALLSGLWMGIPAFRKTGMSIYDRLLNPERRYVAIDWIYGISALTMSLHHIYVTLYVWEIPNGSGMFGTAWIVLAAIGILLGRMWRDPGFWAFVLLFLLKVLRVLIPTPDAIGQAGEILNLTLYAFFFCYSLGRAIRPRMRKGFLTAFCGCWMLGIAVLCGMGLYSAWTGTRIRNLSAAQIYLVPWDKNRLYMIYYSVVSGTMASLGVSLSVLGIGLTRRRTLQGFCVLLLLLMMAAGGLTGTRTAYVFSGIAIALGLGVSMLPRCAVPEGRRGRRLSAGRIIGLCLCCGILAAGLTLAQSYIVDGFQLLRDRGLLISRALADGAADLTHRGFTGAETMDRLLTGRTTIWEMTWETILSEPETLAWGRSVLDPMAGITEKVREALGIWPDHCHNLLLWMLLENGIPGLILFVSVLVWFGICALRLMRDVTRPVWQRLVPVPVIACLLCEMVEGTTIVNFGYPQMTAFYILMGFTVAIGGEKERRRRK